MSTFRRIGTQLVAHSPSMNCRGGPTLEAMAAIDVGVHPAPSHPCDLIARAFPHSVVVRESQGVRGMCSLRLRPRIERAGWRPVPGVSIGGIALRILACRVGATPTRPALLGGLLLGGIAMAGHAAHAVDGVWSGPGGEWTTGANWSSTPTVPDNTATFTNNGAPTSVTISNDASINTMQFSAAAPAYTFATGNFATLSITGGIANGSAFAPTITNTSGATAFLNSSSAGNASIANNQLGLMLFLNSSSAGNATIVNDGVLVSPDNYGGTLNFLDASTAGSATIFNRNNGFTSFNDTATAGSATIVNSNNGLLDRSTFLSGGAYFGATSSAGNATIVNDSGGIAYFFQTSSAANATIINNSGGTTYFVEASSAGNATIVANAGGTVDFSGLTTAGTTAGSIAGAGLYVVGSKQLTVGSNNLSTTVSGIIADGGSSGGVGGSLVKVGSGTLTLSGANTYTGGTTLNAGGLVVNGSLASGVTMNGGTLGGSGTIAGLVANAGTLAPGNSIGTLTVNGNLVQAAGATYQVEVNAAGQGDRINVGGTATINGGTVQVLAQSGTYGRNTSYTILNATGGVAGAYSSVTSNFAFLTPSLSYDANNVYLLLFQPNGAFAAGARTANQRAVGRVLDSANPTATGDFGAVLNALSVLGTLQGPAALTAISGQNYAGFSNAMVQGAQLFLGNFANRAGSRAGGGNQGRRWPKPATSPAIPRRPLCGVCGAARSAAPAPLPATTMPAPLPIASAASRAASIDGSATTSWPASP